MGKCGKIDRSVFVLNRAELANEVSAKTGLSKKEAADAVNAVFDTVIEAVCRGERVSIKGFGTFESKVKKSRKARNPITKEEIEISETVVPVFKSGEKFRNSVSDKLKERKNK